LDLLKEYYPGNIPNELIDEKSFKFGRTSCSIINRIQKLKKDCRQ
jgi:hypothetical protein